MMDAKVTLNLGKHIKNVFSAPSNFVKAKDLPKDTSPDVKSKAIENRRGFVSKRTTQAVASIISISLALTMWLGEWIPPLIGAGIAIVAFFALAGLFHLVGAKLEIKFHHLMRAIAICSIAATLYFEGILFTAILLAFFGVLAFCVFTWVVIAAWNDANIADNLPSGKVDEKKIQRVVASAVLNKNDPVESVIVMGGGLIWDENKRWWSCTLLLPGNHTFTEAKKKIGPIASGLNMGESRILMDGDEENHGLVTIWGTNTNPWTMDPVLSPLLYRENFSIWDPIPFGEDARGREQFVSLLFTNWVIGARPRRGKTFAARLLAMACALDVYCDFDVWDFKGGSDWRMFERLAVASGYGPTDENVLAFRNRLIEIKADIARRAAVIGNLPEARAPHSQITRELAMDESLNLHPHGIFVDEIHAATEHPLLKKEIIQLLADIIRSGPAFGIFLVLATQRPAITSIPAVLRDQCGYRLAFHVATQATSTTIMGTSEHRADKLPSIQGVGLLFGADDTAIIEGSVTLKTHLADTVQVADACRRAEVMRTTMGRIPKPRNENPIQNQTENLVRALPVEIEMMADLLRAKGTDYASDRWMLSEEMAANLGMTRDELASIVKPYGITTSMFGKQRRKGYALSALSALLSPASQPVRD